MAAALWPPPAPGCGPDFPNSMLDRGDEAMLAAPKADFSRDIERIPLPHTRFQAHPADDHAAEAAAADAADLAAALKERDFPAQKREQILAAFEKERNKLTVLRSKLQQWHPEGADEWVDGKLSHRAPEPRPAGEDCNCRALGDAPEEFVQYLRGSVAWFNGQTNQARELWQALLHRPVEERLYRSTWAVYMLGKSWTREDPERAAAYFQKVRALRVEGFADRIGLASASLGEEARVRLQQTNAGAAIDLYLQQLATGDTNAISSLRLACFQTLANGPEGLARLAAYPSARRVMTAYLVADGSRPGEGQTFDANRLAWLQTAESANITDMECAEELALAAYQAGQWDIAQRWIRRSLASPISQWLEVKLLLRSGQTELAAALLHQIIQLLPATSASTHDDKPARLQDVLFMEGSTYTTNVVSMQAQTLAEAGVLHLTRREYTEALDALLRSGFWVDAAYVAERVLTTEELKTYVDRNWPPPRENVETNPADSESRFDVNENIRYLLGRRLARGNDLSVGRAYYPQARLADFDAMARALKAARTAETSGDEKIDALLDAAKLVRSSGMELLGCEVEPDWAVTGGDFDFMGADRAATNAQIVRASSDELERARTGVDPSRRFHYRYDAALLALEAANLMPDNTDQKAVILCTAGTWLKARDPQAADVYYKMLVRHCRKTKIGALADRMRWFPELDAEGNPLPWQPPPPAEASAAQTSAGGFWYLLNRGNTLQDVADIVGQRHQMTITVAEIEKANPILNVNQLKAGLRVFVPKLASAGTVGQ